MAPISVARVFMAGGAAGFGYYLYMRQYWFPNPYKTQGVQNIEDRFSAAGGHPTHAPGTATKMGTTDNTSRQEGGHKGPDSEHHKQNFSEQHDDHAVFPAKLYEQQYGNPKGK